METVFVLFSIDYDGRIHRDVLGIFKTKEEAIKAIDNYVSDGESWDIVPWKLDDPGSRHQKE